MTATRTLLISAIVLGGLSSAALAQTPLSQQQAPNMPPPRTVIPEKIQPEGPSSTGSTGSGATLSDKLEATGGVITPPAGIDPEITAPAPVPNPGTTPIIPPPGSPGGNQLIQPK